MSQEWVRHHPLADQGLKILAHLEIYEKKAPKFLVWIEPQVPVAHSFRGHGSPNPRWLPIDTAFGIPWGCSSDADFAELQSLSTRVKESLRHLF